MRCIRDFTIRFSLHPTPVGRYGRVIGIAGLALLVTFSGCRKFPGPAQMQQFQIDNERLLSEFRAQKKRADDLQARNDQLTHRLNESESTLARVQGSSPANRVSSNDAGRSPLRANSLGGSSGLGIDPRLLPPGSGTLERPSAAGGTSPTPADGMKWRPIRKKP